MASVETPVAAGDVALPSSVHRSRDASKSLTVTHLTGLLPYLPMWERQRMLAAARVRGDIDDRLLLLEHEHVYTNGRRGDREHLLVDDAALERLGVSYHTIDRGGDITYHGPGQLVGYAIIDLSLSGQSVRSYVRGIERAIVQTVAAFGIQAEIIPGLTGVWAGGEKLAAIGVKVSYGVAYHGFALNVAPDLSYFRHIVPCGIPNRGVTSLSRLLRQDISIADVVPACAQAFASVFDFEMYWETESASD